MVRVTGVEPAADSGVNAAPAALRPFILTQEAAGSFPSTQKKKARRAMPFELFGRNVIIGFRQSSESKWTIPQL